MRMRWFVSVLMLMAVAWTPLALAAGGPGPSGDKTPLPNIVVVLVDALRADRLDGTRNGQADMPYLSNMAAHSVRFTNAIAPGSWTRPAMASIFTGLEVEAHEVSTASGKLPASIETMASFLKAAGYSTMGVQANGNLSHTTGFDQGFDEYGYYANPEASAEEITDAALALVAGHTAPFFLYTHYMGPHVPYLPPESYQTLMGYPPAGMALAEQNTVETDFINYTLDQVDYTLGIIPARTYAELSAAGKAGVKTLYDGEARYTDTEVERLLAGSAGILSQYPNTIVILLADHGEHFWEHGQLGHGLSLYEPLLRVPLFLNGPGLSAASIATNVSTLDLLPTLAAVLGLPARAAWQGRSLLEARDPLTPVFSYTRGGVSPRDMDLEAVREGTMKLIHNRRTDGVELYDLGVDPDETTNLAALHPEQVAHLQDLLDAQAELNYRARLRTGVLTRDPSGLIEEGAMLRLTAPTGSNYRWFRNGVLIEDAPTRVSGATTQTLTLNPIFIEDSGTYECEYDDGTNGFRYAQALTLTVYPLYSVPTGGLGELVLLTALFGGLGGRRIRRRDQR